MAHIGIKELLYRDSIIKGCIGFYKDHLGAQ